LRCAALIVVLALIASAPAGALADDGRCDDPSRSWVRIAFSPAEINPALQQEAVKDLRAGLAPNRIDVCFEGAPDAKPPVAELTCAFSDDGGEATIRVVDQLTEKRVERSIRLNDLPPDGRSLALAVESEELLRASWAELAFRASHVVPRPAPPSTAPIPQRIAPAPRLPRFAFGARGAVQHYGGGQTHLGGDAFFSWRISSRWQLEAAIGLRRALVTAAKDGRIETTGFDSELGWSIVAARSKYLDLAADSTLHLAWLDYEAVQSSGGKSASARGLASTLRLGGLAAFGGHGSLRSYTRIGVGYPWLAFSAADSGRSVTGVSSWEVYATTGIGVEF